MKTEVRSFTLPSLGSHEVGEGEPGLKNMPVASEGERPEDGWHDIMNYLQHPHKHYHFHTRATLYEVADHVQEIR